eukprot:TRINITY_DN1575_c0_g3_i1.p1 TRINITY_DN1575_c0_g3~~TRINITY_DN1575_c0_g3_i1.p1  ORF type:complete len:689 (+),score=198.70 TRINITY_DN1575_c0_g3_i1:70-2136(+)
MSRQLATTDAQDVTNRALPAHQAYLQDHIQRMHNEIESTTRKLELEKRRLNKLDEDVTRMRVEHREKVQRNKDNEARAGPSLKKLEHRLGKAMASLNLLGHENTDCRARIDHVRRERLQLIQVFKKLQTDIKENIGQASQLQRDNDAARREQEERAHKMAALKKQVEIERKQFKTTVQKLQKDFKDREREELMQRVQMARENTAHGDDDSMSRSKTKSLQADEEAEFNSTQVMRRILKLAFLNAIQRRHIRQHQKNIEVFEQAFATIKSTTGISDIEEIVKIFVALEQRNFSLLTYVNALNREIESLEKHNRSLKDQLENQKTIEKESEIRRNTAIADILQQIESTSKTTEENKLQATQQAEILDRCKPVIHAILKTVERENRGFGGQAAPEFTGENVLGWLTYVEKTLTQWKDFLPDAKDAKHFKTPSKNYKYTVGNQVLALQPKKHTSAPQTLVKAGELPSAANAFLEQGQNQRAPLAGREEDSSDDEEDLMTHIWSRQELRDKAVASVAKRRRHRRTEAPGGAQGQQSGGAADQSQRPADASENQDKAEGAAELGYEDIVEKNKDADEDSGGSDDSDYDDDVGPSDEEINEIFLKRYKMSKEELQGMAERMGIQLNNLCYLKQEFDAYDEDRSGYIDVKELKGLLEKLGEELNDDELDQAFRELDSDGSGEIEFFEFVEWFTSED